MNLLIAIQLKKNYEIIISYWSAINKMLNLPEFFKIDRIYRYN